mmetsp:Transcript_75651/g.180769  ORF Transcript_75651/g.180769 Transcript_75651/m.180769 type:complete len:253 (-) Transcript_75651:893-1651(-)
MELLGAYIRSGGAEHVPANIAASSQRVHAGLVHGAHRSLHIALQDSMHLPSLSRGDLQSAIREVLANVIHGDPLLRCAEATRKAHTNHEGKSILYAHLLPFFAKVTVILLVAAMRLDQLGVLEGDLTGGDIIQAFLHATTQLLGLNLDLLICLHWAIIAATGGIGLVNTESGEQLALPLGEASVVLVCVLVITEACGHHALRSHLLEKIVQVTCRLGKVELGLLGALAPVVRITEAEDAILQIAERQVASLL